jgi:hypothetical protein
VRFIELHTRTKYSLSGVGIGFADPLLVGVPVVTSPDLELVAVGNFSVAEIDAFVGATPLEGKIRHRDPLLVGVPLCAGPDLELRPVGIDASRDIDTLEESQEDEEKRQALDAHLVTED